MLAEYVAEIIGGAVGLFALGLLGLYFRRVLLQRGGTIDLSLRLKDTGPGRGWVHGIGRFDGDDLVWYRVFSPSLRPRRRVHRRGLVVLERREPRSNERRALPGGLLVVRCRTLHGDVELAMNASATTGFLAWLEATPPGATLPP